MKTWIIYFSRADGNWVDGGEKNLEVGNTEVIARTLSSLTGGELFKLEMLHPYSKDYIPCTEEAKRDQVEDLRPPLKTPLPSLEDGDIVYLGYPIYWDLMPMCVLTFLESYAPFPEVTIYPFVTHEGSGLGASMSMLKRKAAPALVTSPLPIPGSYAAKAEPLLKEWVHSHKR